MQDNIAFAMSSIASIMFVLISFAVVHTTTGEAKTYAQLTWLVFLLTDAFFDTEYPVHTKLPRAFVIGLIGIRKSPTYSFYLAAIIIVSSAAIVIILLKHALYTAKYKH